ncbi:MAG TPA: fasciclin domain-containing protein [Chitinophagaceae bacterium]|nr:fasciclin domain-containing protein [Chitinophagaceae bacterium]
MKNIKIHFKTIILGMALLYAGNTFAQSNDMQTDPMVGGAAMYPAKNIVENAVNSKDHTTLVAAVKAAGLVETLEGSGPLTVFAPTNKAFDKLPAGTVDALLKPENKAKLTSVLTYHVIAGKIDSHMLMDWIKKNNGSYIAKTVEGGELKFWMKGKNLYVTDEMGNSAKITIKDVYQKNGIIHVIDTVLMPKA